MASTNQAASAESLQRPTASLENLIARSRIREDIPPAVPEGASESPTTPEAGTEPSSVVSSSATLSGVPEYGSVEAAQTAASGEGATGKPVTSRLATGDSRFRSRVREMRVSAAESAAESVLGKVTEEGEAPSELAPNNAASTPNNNKLNNAAVVTVEGSGSNLDAALTNELNSIAATMGSNRCANVDGKIIIPIGERPIVLDA